MEATVGCDYWLVITGLMAFSMAWPSLANGALPVTKDAASMDAEGTEQVDLHRYHLPASSGAASLVSGILACQSDPCSHGLCIDHVNNSSYSCFCEDGYTGFQCQTDWNECWNGPCINGATCVDGIGRYDCLCRPGYTGNDCQIDIDECQSDPCQNGATCQDGPNGYRCRCLPGYEGVFCQVDVAVCRHQQQQPQPPHKDGNSERDLFPPPTCRHGARCVEGPGLAYYCLCPEGWTGKHCETDVDECCSNPCKNDGLCIDLTGSYQCACAHGFTGRHCETALERCDDKYCGYQGICWLEGDDGQTSCYCRPDYHGSHCEKQYDECLLPGTKCLNDGQCIDQVDGYSCSCPPLWTGPRCQTANHEAEDEEEATAMATTANVWPMTVVSGQYSTVSTTTVSDATIRHSSPSTPESDERQPTAVDGALEMENSVSTTTMGRSEETTTSIINGSMAHDLTWPTTIVSDEKTESTTDDLLDETSLIPIETTTTEATTELQATGQSSFETLSTWVVFVSPSTSPSTDDGQNERTSSKTVGRSSSKAPAMMTWPSSRFDHEISSVTAATEAATTVDASTLSTRPHSQRQTKEVPSSDNTITVATSRRPAQVDDVTATREDERPMTNDGHFYFADEDALLPTPMTARVTNDSLMMSTIPREVVDIGLPSTMSPMTTVSTVLAGEGASMEPSWVPGDILAMTCDSNICMNGGTCVMTAEGWQCRCSWRNEGRRCENDRQLKVPQFHGNSYLSYAVADRMQADHQDDHQVLEARLEFSTTAPLGLIAYIHSADAHVYLAVYVERSALKFRLSCGRQQMTLVETKYNVSDGDVHAILMRFLKVDERNSSTSFCMGSVKLNNSYSMNGEQRLAGDEPLIWPRRLHIGGRPYGVATPAELVFLPGIVGCAYSLQIDGQRLDMMADAVQGKALDECPDGRTRCGGVRCLNGGTCHTDLDGDTADPLLPSMDQGARAASRCLCPMGWVGDQCEIRQCPCNPCQVNSTCLMSATDQMICVCSYGRVGSLCEIAVNVSRPQFDGTLMGHSSYLSLAAPPFIGQHFELKFSFVTDDARQVALLLFIGPPVEHVDRLTASSGEEKKDFLAVSFIRGHVALTWDLGSGARRIFTARPVSVSTMGGHSVHIGMRGRVAWLQVNNQPTVTGRSPGLMSALSTHPSLFLGGHVSFNHSRLPSDLPLHSGFRGCIYDLVFRSRELADGDQPFDAHNTVHHWVPIVKSGRGVRQCSIPSCRLRMSNDVTADDITSRSGNAGHPTFEDDRC